VNVAAITVLVLAFVAGGVLAVVRWSRRRLSASIFLVALLAISALNVAGFVNMWPAVTAGFRTEIDFGLQAALVLAGLLLVLLSTGSVIALNIGLAHRWLPSPPPTRRISTVIAGIGLGAFLAGLGTLVSHLGPDRAPTWADTSGASAMIPALEALLSPVGRWITLTALLLVFVAVAQAGTAGWTRRRVPFALVGLVLGLVLAGRGDIESPRLWLVSGLATGAALLAAYVLVLRHEVGLLPLATAALASLNVLGQGLMDGYDGVLTGAILGVVVLLVLGDVWSRALAREPPGAESTSSPPTHST
jgi:hypothetical protein